MNGTVTEAEARVRYAATFALNTFCIGNLGLIDHIHRVRIRGWWKPVHKPLIQVICDYYGWG